MSDQASLGEYFAESGMKQAWDNTRDATKAALKLALDKCITRGHPFTAEDIRELAGDPPGASKPMGSLLRNARRKGRIVQIGHAIAQRPSLHGAEIKRWIRADLGEAR